MRLKPILVTTILIPLFLGAVYYFTRPQSKSLIQIRIKGEDLTHYFSDKKAEKQPDVPGEQTQTIEEGQIEPGIVTTENSETTKDEAGQTSAGEVSDQEKEAISVWTKNLEQAWLTGNFDLYTSSLSCFEGNQEYCEERLKNFKDRQAEKDYQRVEFRLEGIEKKGENLKIYVHEIYDYLVKSTSQPTLSEVNYVYNLEKVNNEWKSYSEYKN